MRASPVNFPPRWREKWGNVVTSTLASGISRRRLVRRQGFHRIPAPCIPRKEERPEAGERPAFFEPRGCARTVKLRREPTGSPDDRAGASLLSGSRPAEGGPVPQRGGEAAEEEKAAAPSCAGRPSCCGGGEPYRFFCRMEMFSMEREGRFMPPYLTLFRSCLSFEKETAYGKHRVFFWQERIAGDCLQKRTGRETHGTCREKGYRPDKEYRREEERERRQVLQKIEKLDVPDDMPFLGKKRKKRKNFFVNRKQELFFAKK